MGVRAEISYKTILKKLDLRMWKKKIAPCTLSIEMTRSQANCQLISILEIFKKLVNPVLFFNYDFNNRGHKSNDNTKIAFLLALGLSTMSI